VAGPGISAFGPDTFHMKRSGRKLHLWSLNAPALLWAAVGAPMLGSSEKAELAGPLSLRLGSNAPYPEAVGASLRWLWRGLNPHRRR
jgi:hypothetical protein